MGMFNLLIAILLDEFSTGRQQESHVVTPDMIEKYSLVWRDLDPKATHFIPCDLLPHLLKKLDAPLGCGEEATAHECLDKMKDLNLKVSRGQAHFVETFMALVTNAYQIAEMDPEMYNKIVEELVDSFPSLTEVDPTAEKDAIHTFAAIKLQAVARGFRARSMGKKVGWKELAKISKVSSTIHALPMLPHRVTSPK